MRPVLSAILSLSSTVLTDDEKRIIEKYNPAGIALFSRNMESQKQVSDLTKSIREVVGHGDIFIALDEEGGRVDRLKKVTHREFYSQSLLGKIGSVEIVKQHGILISDEMHKVGANLNFAPVLDLDYKDMTNALKSRTFSKGPKKTAKLGKTLYTTYVAQGICPCIKHMPGHGRAQNDPHLGLPVIEEDLKTLSRDFYPFIENKDCPAGMTAHILLKSVDDKAPITFSKKGIEQIIRGLIGFDGFLISDALEMGALKGSVAARTKASLEAGVDAVCYCMGDIDGLEAVCRNASFLGDNGLERLNRMQSVLKTHKQQRNLDFIKKSYYSKKNLFAEQNINYDATEVLFQLQKGIG